MKFSKRSFPGVEDSIIPTDIILELPENLKIEEKYWHYLVYIPWDDKYLDKVPSDFRDFFKFVLPHLKVRTTDIHTAISSSYLDLMINKFPDFEINRRVVAISLILHDCGWSKLSELEIANSLGVTGLKLNEVAIGPKEKHAVEGEKLAKELLSQFQFTPELSDKEKQTIFKAIRYHDKPEEVAGSDQDLPIEVKLLVDLDHIWSFIFEDFWLDTVRKGISPADYLENLFNDLDSYFVTEPGKKLARKLLIDRRAEIKNL